MNAANSPTKTDQVRRKTPQPGEFELSPTHYLRIILHRKWVVLGTFVVVSLATILFASRLPNIYTSQTLIMVDPQRVPESYVKSTVTGDVRNRLGTLSQQIMSETRLLTIIDSLNLYAEEKKRMTREDVIMRMRADVHTIVASDFGGSQDLQAFRISYSGRDPRLVAQVTNELANLFINENLKARSRQATETTDFLSHQLQDARKTLEEQEGRLKEFRLKHVGEMPEQQAADLQILGQLQAQLQTENDAVSRAQQQKDLIRSMMNQNAPVVDTDTGEEKGPSSRAAEAKPAAVVAETALSADRKRLAALLSRYSEDHPDVRKLKATIALEEKAAAAQVVAAEPVKAEEPAKPAAPAPAPPRRPAPSYTNPVLQAQLKGLDDDIAKHQAEQQRVNKMIVGYQAKVNAIPLREQEVTALVRDYEMSKSHYTQLLDKQLSAETATQLELREQGEKFVVLDTAVPAEKPSKPNRPLIDAAGSLGGLGLGLLLALMSELLGMSITEPKDIIACTGFPVLEIIPVIQTHYDRVVRRRRVIWATLSMTAMVLISAALYFYRDHLPGL
jgi:polysaccharide chain length determinant protein (PEP-CTERM system associated)